MVSLPQIKANKQNALKSTGPKTIDGKKEASKNSLKHGLLSKDLIIKEEKPEDLLKFKNNIYTSLQPEGAMEELLVEKIVNAAWRLQRVFQIEGEMFQKNGYYHLSPLNEAFRGFEGNCMNNLSRYESMLERNFYKAIHELQRIQGLRSGQNVLAPVAIDITSPE
ncbi:MAG: hypothetical protein JXA94_05775 [Parachlamydiales bacterium]|nr:hypothetical protein [Parachlamydiales bacterium]